MATNLPKCIVTHLFGVGALAATVSWSPDAAAQNLISNGTFDSDSSPWWGHAADGFEQELEVVEGQLCSTIIEGGENPWDIIVGYSGVPLVANQYYHVSFTATSDAPRPIRYKTGLGDDPYTDYYLGKIDLSPTPQVFEVTYLNLRDDTDAQFQFQFGGGPGRVCYDNIVVEPVEPPVVPVHVPPSSSGLPLKAHTDTIKLGTAVDTPIFLSSPLHNSIVASEFSMITPANSMKMNIIQPVQGEFDFADTDALLAWAGQNGLEFHGHPLVWHTQVPNWLQDGEFDRDAMIAIMYAHIDALMTRYAGQMPYWDVVNEAVDQVEGGGWGFRSTIWHDRIGEDFIDLAFIRANQLDPNTKLLYNDYNISIMGDGKADHVFDMISSMVSRGIPVHQVGMQNHWYIREDGTANANVPAFRANLERFASIGVGVQITECDVRIHEPVTAEKLQTQAQIYADILQACIDAPNCEHMTVWGLSDVDSWVPSTFPNEGAAHLFDEALQAKPAYQSMSDALVAFAATQSMTPVDEQMPPVDQGVTADSDDGGGGCSAHPGGSETASLRWMFVGLLGLALGTRRRSTCR